MQLCGLALSAGRVRLAAQFPEPAESLAVPIMLAIQFSWVAILFPLLCRSWRMGLLVAASGWVMLLFAAALAAWPLQQIVPAGGYLTLWIASLVLWRKVLQRDWLQMMGSSLATAFTVGGPLLWYLRLDLGEHPGSMSSPAFGPLTPVLMNPRRPALGGWITVLLLAVLGVLALLTRGYSSRRNRGG